ncbi:unconventional myosin-VIIa [Aplysia californica]|uniref:non-specific serine/threonine protein kinase n=1 Tax=Aplysia californica TaxID=6500 RepID=A0ABM1W4W9_APLCA|nr:unconventional myosin-VIIa [Aplysia californica]
MDRPPLGDVQDLATLAKLDETILLDEIKERYQQNKIYTYVGDILIAVNPFKDLGIYTKEFSTRYQHIKQSTHPPHIFAVADAAYQALMGNGGRPPGNQCVLISGESGAGKTESTKLIIKQLVELCQGKTQLEQQILQVNPLLEAFGNAQTNLNDNSSRFGKYIQLKFNDGHVAGAKISEYLLEKSRVVRQNPGEESFHIFYYLFAGHTDGTFGLGDPDTYRYFSNGARDFKKRLNSLQKQYDDLVNAMDLVGFTDEEQMDMFAVIASVLHLGNVSFKVNEDDSVSVTDSNGPVKTAAKLLGIDAAEIEACLTCMVTVTKGEYVKRNYNKGQAEDARDAMAKAVYGRLFGWIVNKVNCLLVPENQDPDAKFNEIGILDIFGFEDFVKDGGKNSFEQACINLANEQLQFFFNQHIFKMEQEEYQREGVDWKEIKFVDNKPLLDMFLGKPIGILSLLDEESLFPKGTDQSYVDKLTKAFTGNQYFVKSQQTNQAIFSINHYAGKVTYAAEKWLEKNRDTLPPGITEVLQSSENRLVKTIFRGQLTRTGSLALQGRMSTSKGTKRRNLMPVSSGNDAAKRKLTVGGQFKNSLAILMERMTASTPIFVRCLKPNHKKQPGVLDTKYVLAQLLYTGMLETIEIRRKGFAVRPTFGEFVEKYKVLVDLKLTPSAQNCSKILTTARLQGWYVGYTKVFLKYRHVEQLTELLEKVGKSAICIQKYTKGYLARKRYRRRQEKARKEREAVEAMLRQAAQLNAEASTRLHTLTEHDKTKPKDQVKPAKTPSAPDFPADGISVASSGRYLEPKKTTTSIGTQMEEESGSDSEILEDDYQPVSSNLKKFGREGTKTAAINWFKETQTYNVVDKNENKFSEWFHGIISRRESEKLLKDRIVGCFLLRVSESRFGYTLSFKAESRCRHYMIDQLKNGKFIIVGEPKVHRSLHDMVSYHRKGKFKNGAHFLTVPVLVVR